MAVSFEQARAIADAECRPEWEAALGDRGTFMVGDWGFEDDESYSMVVGCKEYIVDDDDTFVRYDAPSILVDKRTGEVSRVNFLMNRARLREMTPLGPVPEEHLISAEDV